VTCLKCESSHFLSIDKCLDLSQVQNCQEYSPTEDKCILCNSNYLLSKNQCLQIPQIQYCSKYEISEGNENEIICTECQKSTFLSSDNVCIRRSYSLDLLTNCTALEDHLDQCRTCAEGFDLSSNKLSCLPLVPNCLNHSLVSEPTERFQCQECEDTFTLSPQPNVCFQSLSGCSHYNETFDSCEECHNQTYFLGSRGTCESRTFVSVNCQEYEASLDQCKVCKESFRLTSDSLNCLPAISFCLV
jgi:hypothetical protein